MTIFSLKKRKADPGSLVITDLRVTYATDEGDVEAVRGVTTSLSAGKVLAVVGQSGCGKSTLVASVLGLLPESAVAFGRVMFEDVDILSAEESQLRTVRGHRIGFVGQDSFEAFDPLFGLGFQLREALAAHRHLPRTTRNARILETLDRTKLPLMPGDLGIHPHEMSGGMLQRAQIAAAILHEPSLLVCDEPTAALDPTLRVQLADLLMALRDELGTAIFLATHDLTLVSRLADEVLVMYDGRVVESGPTPQILGHPRHPFTEALVEAHAQIASSVWNRGDGHAGD